MSVPRLLSDGTVLAQPGDQVSPGRAPRGTLGGPVGDELTLPGDIPPAAIPSMSDDATPAGHFLTRWTRPDDLGGDEPVAHCPKCGRMLVEAVELRD